MSAISKTTIPSSAQDPKAANEKKHKYCSNTMNHVAARRILAAHPSLTEKGANLLLKGRMLPVNQQPTSPKGFKE